MFCLVIGQLLGNELSAFLIIRAMPGKWTSRHLSKDGFYTFDTNEVNVQFAPPAIFGDVFIGTTANQQLTAGNMLNIIIPQ